MLSKTAGAVTGGLRIARYVDSIPEPLLSVSNAAASGTALASTADETEFALGA